MHLQKLGRAAFHLLVNGLRSASVTVLVMLIGVFCSQVTMVQVLRDLNALLLVSLAVFLGGWLVFMILDMDAFRS